MGNLLLICSRVFLWALVCVLMVLAIALSVGKELLQDVNSFREDIELFASEKTGFRVRVGGLHGAWEGMRPELLITELDVRSFRSEERHVKNNSEHFPEPSPTLFSAQKIKLQWLILSSIRNLEPRINMWIDGATLELVYHDGFLLPAGMSPPSADLDKGVDIDNDASYRLVDYINRQPHLELTNSRVNIDGMWPEKAGFNDVNVLMVNRLGYREIDARFSLSGPSESMVQMYGRVKGSMVNLKTLQGDYYLNVENAPIVPWLPEGMRRFEHLELESAFGGVELWGRVNQGVVHRITANVELDDVVINNTQELRQATLRKAEGVLQYRYLAEGEAQLVLNDFHMEHELFVWDPALLSLNIQRSGGSDPKKWTFDLLLDEINIAPWVQYYIDFTAAESTGRDMLTHTSPQGILQDVHLRATLQEGQLDNMYASAEVLDFAMLPYKFIPGVQNLHADFELNESLGFVSLHSDDLLLDYPALMREKLQFDWFDAQLQVKLSDENIVMETGLVALNNEEIRTATQMSMWFSRDTSVSPRIRALSTLRGVDASLTPKYLPAGILQEGLITFLDGSVIGGDLLRGDILFNGPLRWRKQEEDLNMQLGFMLDDTEFRFLPDWTPVTNTQVDVIVDRVFIDAYIIDGTYYGASIDQLLATTRREVKDDPFLLTVSGLVNGTASQGLDILQRSPLRSKIGGFVDEIALDGGMALGLNLSLLLAKGDVELALDLDVDIEQGMFSMPEQKLKVENVNGDFTFDLINGIRSEQMSGRIFGGDVSANISPVFKHKIVEGDDQRNVPARELLSTRINMVGEASLPLVADWLSFPGLNYLSGNIPYNATLTLPKSKASPPDISVQSSLKGVAVQLPKPFYKGSDAERDLYIYTTLGAEQREDTNGNSRIFSLRYGEVIDFVSEIESSRLKKAAIVFGGVGRGKAVLPKENGYRIGGLLSEFSVKAWTDIFNAPSVGDVKEERLTAEGGDTLRTPLQIEQPLLDGNLKIDNVLVFGQSFPETYLHFKPSNVTWDIDVNGQGIDAKFSLPKYLLKPNQKLHQQELPVVASFSQLQLSKSEGFRRKISEELVKKTGLNPATLPPLVLKIDNLLLGNEPFGRWDMQLKPVPEGVLIEPLLVYLKATDFSGKGSWLNDDGVGETSVQGVATAGNVADVLRGWGKQPSLDSSGATASLNARWPGAPFEFDVLATDAAMSIKIKDGHFLNVNSGAVDKVWGALNFQTMLKRLQLNFSDLSSDDLTFEKIDGALRLQNKVLTVENMEVDSPAVGIALKGDVLLAEEKLALKLEVAIPVTRNLVLPAAAVGGLPAAATAYVIEKVLGKQLDKLTTVKYTVKGTFDNPEIKVKDSFSVIPKPLRESMFSTGSKDSNKGKDEKAKKIVEEGVETGVK
ncbi:hypothetical protein A9Q81_09470 [Gammaproteobacteria bacterium 42_54_T18]|nr:hypothetical protein A9Q81_09470 [Gammaproteobacteria bacterium 42_54_T18]